MVPPRAVVGARPVREDEGLRVGDEQRRRQGAERDDRRHRPPVGGVPASRSPSPSPRHRVRYELRDLGPDGVVLHPVVDVHLAALGPDRTRILWRSVNRRPDGVPEDARQQMAPRARDLRVEDLEAHVDVG